MSISSTQLQLTDYLTQIKKLPGKKSLPKKTVKVKPLLEVAKLGEQKIINKPDNEFLSNVIYEPLVISYRGHESSKDGEGMLFDHMRLQDLTKFPTRTLVPENTSVVRNATEVFKNALKVHPSRLLFGERDENLITYPENVQECANLGLLIIPGRAKAVENEPIRLAHEYNIIRGALNRGQPILGICAGSWRLYEQLYMWTKSPNKMNVNAVDLSSWHNLNNTLIDVKDHSYNGGMIRLDANGVQSSYNVQIHDITIKQNSMLNIAMNIFGTETVNSVHWKAVNKDKLPGNVQICAEAMKCPTIHVNTRQGVKMNPQEGIAEAFENVHGVPLLGVQWHPEAYSINTSHAKLINYMVLAGNAYAAKRQMLRDLETNPLVLKTHLI